MCKYMYNMMQVCTLYVVCTRNVVCAHTHMYIIVAQHNTLSHHKVTVSEVQAASPCQWTGDANSTSQSTVLLFPARRSRNSHHSYIHTSHSPSLIYSIPSQCTRIVELYFVYIHVHHGQ